MKNSSSIYKSPINAYSIDFYGNYVDTSIKYEALNYFFYVYILTKTFIIIKPIKINYKNKIRFNLRSVQYVFKSGKILRVELTNYGMFKFKRILIKYSKEKEIDFEIENINNTVNKKNHRVSLYFR